MKIMEAIRKRAENPFAAPTVTIACLGDSVTHGCFEMFVDITGTVNTRYSPGESYVQKLQNTFNLIFPVAAVNVVNCGISGDRADQAIRRYERDVQCYNPQLVVVCYGLNDCISPAITAESYAEDMGLLFDKVHSSGAECILLTPNMMGTYVDTSIQNPLIREVAATNIQAQCDGTLSRFVKASCEAALSRDVCVADAYAVWQAMYKAGADTTGLLANRINHPMPFMHDIFTQKIIECMLGLNGGK